MSTCEIINADCLEHMRTMPDNSVDAVITDPPYGLAFMGANWDHNVPNAAYWSECLRVAKPGAHLLCFGGTRTFHRMACAIEDAGWEIRDCIMWVYGSGFPKSMDVAKTIDKASGYVGEVIGERTVDVGMQGGHMHAGRKQQQQQQQVRSLSPEAKEWEGWGTCLKPAWEPIIVARKPLDGTVVHNVLTWGVGALNIDACRVSIEQGDDVFAKNPHTRSKGKDSGIYGKYDAMKSDWSGEKGRFPANLVHDGSQMVLDLFPETQRADGHTIRRNATHDNVYCGYSGKQPTGTMHRDSGGSAARFFYCAKASKKDRGEGNTHPTVKPTALMEWLVKMVTREGQTVLDPFMGSGSTLVACKRLDRDCVGIERESEYCDIAQRRLGDA